MEHGIHDLSAGYALDALDADERTAFEAHLAGCERCRRDVDSFLEVGAALAVGAAGPAPPPELRERIVAGVRAERQNVVPLAARRSRVAPAFGAIAAVAAVVALGVGLYAVSLSGDLDDTRSALERERAIAAVLADPAATRELDGASGRLVVGDDSRAVLVVDGLPPAPEGKTYQVWVVQGGAPVSGGLFASEGGAVTVAVSEPVAAGAVVAVTVEDAAGAEAPTSDPVVASQPV